jgi:NaMN:DMB phosphoribosyltransferase
MVTVATMRRVCFQAVEGAALDVLQSIGDLMQPFILTGVIADHFGGAFDVAVAGFETGAIALAREAGEPDCTDRNGLSRREV